MYETQRAIFERLNNNANLKNPAAPNRIYGEPEVADWDREDGLDYRNYYTVRTGSFSRIGTDHGSAVEYCQKQRIERGAQAHKENQTMNIKITETGEIKTLTIKSSNGIEWTTDLIGNAGGFVEEQFIWSEEEGAYLTDQDTYDWWDKYIIDSNATDEEVTAMADELGVEEGIITERIAANTSTDYERHRWEAKQAMASIREEYSTETEEA